MKAAAYKFRVLLFAALAMIATTFLHGGSWVPPTSLQSIGNNLGRAEITLDGDGNATALWTDATNVFTATKPYGAPWDPTESLAFSAIDTISSVSLATSSSGHSIAVWLIGVTNTLYYSTRTFGGSWSVGAVVPVSLANRMSVTIDESGNATLIYLSSFTDVYALSLPFGGSWSSTTLISPISGAYLLDITVDGSGNVAAIFGPSLSPNFNVYIAELPFGGSWAPAINIDSATDGVSDVAIDADTNGNFAAAWNPENSGIRNIKAATKDFGGSWSSPTLLSNASEESSAPNIAIDSGGNSVAAWQEGSEFVSQIAYTADRPFGGAWQPAFGVSDPNGSVATSTTLDVNPDGYATIAYTSNLTNHPYAARRPIQGAWSAPVEVSNALDTRDFGLGVGVDPFNNSYLVFGVADGNDLDASNTIPNPWVPPVIQTWGKVDRTILVGDNLGNTTNIWSDFTTKDLYYREKIANGLWSDATSFASVVHNYLLSVDASMNGTGYTLAYWTERNTSVGPNLQYLYAASQQFGGAWSASTLLLTTTATEIPVVGVVDSSGNAVIVYTDNTTNTTVSRTLPFGGSWGSPVTITTDPLGAARDLVIDGSNNITFVVDKAAQVVAYSLPFGGSWSGPVNVSGVTTAIFRIHAAANSAGNVEAIWEASDSGLRSGEATHPFGGSWSSPTDFGLGSFRPSIAIDDAGNAVATWVDIIGVGVVRGASKVAGGSWGASVDISDGLSEASDSSLSMNGSGVALALWSQNKGTIDTPRQSILNFGGSWTTPIEIENLASIFTQVFVDPFNRATAIWGDTDAEFIQPFYASSRSLGPVVYDVSPPFGPIAGGTVVTITGAGFTGATQVFFDGVPATSFVVVDDETITAISPAHAVGPVFVTVQTDIGTSPDVDVGIFTYVTEPVVYDLAPSSGPTAGGTVVTITGAGFTGATQVFFDGIPATSFTVLDDGTITAVSPPHALGPVFVRVQTPEGTSPEVDVGIFTYIDSGQPLPPASFTGKTGGDRFLTQTDLYNFLRWTASPDPGVVSYRIYRDGDLLAEISADNPPQYIDHNRRKKVTYVYTLVAVNGSGNESTQLVVILTNR